MSALFFSTAGECLVSFHHHAIPSIDPPDKVTVYIQWKKIRVPD